MRRQPADVQHAERGDGDVLDLPLAQRMPQREAEPEQQRRGQQEVGLARVGTERHPQQPERAREPEPRARVEPLAAHHAVELEQPEDRLRGDEQQERPPALREQHEQRHEQHAARDAERQGPAGGLRPSCGRRLGVRCLRHREAQSTRPNRRSRIW
jgi:hypothetical protein